MSIAKARMPIEILQGLQGAHKARGTTVVIDVLRAFSTACYVMAAGAQRLITVAEIDAARDMRRHDANVVLVGERHGFRPAAFDMGNCPSRVPDFDWTGRTVIMTTSNGTMGLTAAAHASQILTGSFVNAGAIIKYIRHQAPAPVSLVCMGSQGREAVEDTLCAEYLKSGLMGKQTDFGPIRQTIWESPEAARFMNGTSPDFPAEDLDLCLCLDRFDFVLRVEKGPDGGIELVRC